jgi:integrase
VRWDDIDFDGGTIHILQQLQRVRGELFLAPVKTQAGQRGLPLLDVAAQALKLQAERQAHYRIDMGSAWPESGLVFTTRTGRPVEPRTSCAPSGASATTTRFGSSRFTTSGARLAGCSKDLGVPARDAQTILGHTRISTTLEIYTDTDEQARRDALTRLQSLLGDTQN